MSSLRYQTAHFVPGKHSVPAFLNAIMLLYYTFVARVYDMHSNIMNDTVKIIWRRYANRRSRRILGRKSGLPRRILRTVSTYTEERSRGELVSPRHTAKATARSRMYTLSRAFIRNCSAAESDLCPSLSRDTQWCT